MTHSVEKPLASSRPHAKPFGPFERAMAWRYVRAKRENGGVSFIAMISFFGVALATFALIVVLSVMGAFRTLLLDDLLKGQPHIQLDVSGYDRELVDILSNEIRRIEGVNLVIPGVEQAVVVFHEGKRAFAQVRGIRRADLASLPFFGGQEAALETLGYDEGPKGGNKIIVGYVLAEQLGLYPGGELTIMASQARRTTILGAAPRSKAYEVLGAFRSGAKTVDQLAVFMPLSQAQILFNFKGKITLLDIRLDDPTQLQEMATRITLQLDTLKESFPDGLVMQDWMENEAQRLNALMIERFMMRMILLVLVMVTALNIIIGIVMLVKNKTRDIAILRTVGMSRAAIVRVFVMIGAALGVLGAICGIGLGVLTVLNIALVEGVINSALGLQISGLPARIEWGEVAFASLFSFVMAAIVTLIPAWGAARLDPVKALRFE